MPGPAPKPASERANRTLPARGEWVDVAAPERPILPELPAGQWSDRTVAYWRGLQADPVTSTFGSAEIAQCVELAYLHMLALDSEKVSAWSELRQREDRLGLSLKGKRDLRFRVTDVRNAKAPAGKLVAMPSSR